MKEVTIRGQRVPSLMQGCMRISNLSETQVDALLHFDLEHGINFLTMLTSMVEKVFVKLFLGMC